MHFYAIAMCFILLLTTGCGFHLRGHLKFDPKFQTLAITPYQPYESFQKTLRHLLRTYHIQTARQEPTFQLAILKQEMSEQVLAYDLSGQPYRLLIKFTVTYQLTDKAGKILISSAVLEVGREINANVQDRLSNEHERAQLETELYRDIAMQLLYQLAASSHKAP